MAPNDIEPNESIVPVPQWDMEKMARGYSLSLAKYWNDSNHKEFLSAAIPNWVKGVMENGNKWLLPESPMRVSPSIRWITGAGWNPTMTPDGVMFSEAEIVALLDNEWRENNAGSLWEKVPSAVLALLGFNPPSTPEGFGNPVGAIPGAFWVNTAGVGYVTPGTVVTRDGIKYECISTPIMQYWRPTVK